jgi:hypothetical protein
MPEGFDPTAWSGVLGVTGGYFLCVLLGVYVVRKFTTGKWVTLTQLEREITQARLDAETWKTIAREADDRADTDRETTRALLAAANVSVRSVQLLSQQLPEQLPQAAGEGT